MVESIKEIPTFAPNAQLRTRLSPQKPVKDRAAQLAQVCRDFESLFVAYMMHQMRETVPQDGLFNGGRAEQMYASMLDSEVAKSISQQRGIGLAPMLYRQMISLAGEEQNEKNK